MRTLLSILVLAVLITTLVQPCYGWADGFAVGMSSGCSKCYGTHDFLAEHALTFLPYDPAYFWLMTYGSRPYGVLANEMFLYGTEIPDLGAWGFMGTGFTQDRRLHSVYYASDGSLVDDYSAKRAQESYERVIAYLNSGDMDSAAKWMGITSHYVTDVTSYWHVMGKGDEWVEAAKNGLAYENRVNVYTSSYTAGFASCLHFDGKLEHTSPYDITLKLAYDTTFDTSGAGRTPKWMDDNFETIGIDQPNINRGMWDRVCQSLNLAVNAVTDLIYSTTLDVTATKTVTTSTSSAFSSAATSSTPLTTSTVASTPTMVANTPPAEPFPYLSVGVVAVMSLVLGMMLAYFLFTWSRRRPARTVGSRILFEVNAQ